jgi:hypothetical protein
MSHLEPKAEKSSEAEMIEEEDTEEDVSNLLTETTFNRGFEIDDEEEGEEEMEEQEDEEEEEMGKKYINNKIIFSKSSLCS